MKKACFLLALLLCLALPAGRALADDSPAVSVCGAYEYILLPDGTAEIVKFWYNDSDRHVTVPTELDGYTVSSIGDQAFYACKKLTSIIIPEGITIIGDRAFDSCHKLISVTLPDSVTEIGVNPFTDCRSLLDISLPPDHPLFAVVDGVLFNKAERKLICYLPALTNTEYTIPQDTLIIGEYAFYHCQNLTSVTIPEGLTIIEDDAFYTSQSLTGIALPNSITHIGANPFADCESLRTITVSPEHPFLTVIDGVLFNEAEKKLICYPPGNKRSRYTVPKGTLIIGEEAFLRCLHLKSVTLPDGLTVIGVNAFSCAQITAMSIPDSVTSIGDYAFYYCTKMTKLTLPPGITSIGYKTFAYCESLKRLVIPDGVTSIDSWAFDFCKSLTSVTIPNSVVSIGICTFYHCDKLVITVSPDSFAVQYCEDNDLSYIYSKN